jgi:uncharacterized protein YeaO (DUF488 family)
MIILNREQIRYSGEDRIDITVKSATNWARNLAPTWDMVWAHKNGKISDKEYTEQYIDLIEKNGIPLNELLEFNKITFVCYCPNGKFCHTHLLIDYLLEQYPNLFEDGRK